MERTKAERLRGKLTKDRADILALLDPQPKNYILKEEFDSQVFHRLVEGLERDVTIETITELPKYNDSIQLYNPAFNSKKVKEWIRKIVR
jgi:hypothetical protein